LTDNSDAAEGVAIGVAADLQHTEPPTDEELRLLRDEVDPMRYVIGR
jgi:hypothetical protein